MYPVEIPKEVKGSDIVRFLTFSKGDLSENISYVQDLIDNWHGYRNYIPDDDESIFNVTFLRGEGWNTKCCPLTVEHVCFGELMEELVVNIPRDN